jgi:hypothetical protein
MTTDVATQALPVPIKRGRGAIKHIRPRLRAALMEMVWSGKHRADAAKAAGMTDHSLREALRKPHVKAAYLAELEVLRLSARARAFHRLVELSEQDDNKGAAVAAVRTMVLEGQDEAQRGFGAVASPGLTIQIISSSDAVKVAPTIEHDDGE